MKDNRPVNLSLTAFRWPITALVSITHRVTGVALYGGVLILLWLLQESLASEEGFIATRDVLMNPVCKAILWLVLAALAYHTVMGIRHLIMDMGIGESLEGGRRGAVFAVVVAVICIVLAGVWVW